MCDGCPASRSWPGPALLLFVFSSWLNLRPPAAEGERSCLLPDNTFQVWWDSMELRHLKYFVAVAEEQNVTRASARLHISQPPLSRQIRDLEEELGVALFERTPKALRLTAAGRVFLNEAQAVLRRAEQAVETVKSAASADNGQIDVAYAPSLTVQILPATLRQFQSEAPGVRV